MRPRAMLLVAALLWPAAGAPAQEQEQMPITVEVRDGTRVPLLTWTLSYEYATWAKDSSPAMAAPQVREINEIYAGKKSFPVAGQLEFEFEKMKLPRFQDVEMTTAEVLQPTRMTVVEPGGKRHRFERSDPPHKDRVAPDVGGDYLYQARAFYVSGVTLTGTHRRYCLLTYTSLSECSDDPSLQVVRIEFP